MAIRLNEEMRLKHKTKAGKGHIINSAGVGDDETWGQEGGMVRLLWTG